MRQCAIRAVRSATVTASVHNSTLLSTSTSTLGCIPLLHLLQGQRYRSVDCHYYSGGTPQGRLPLLCKPVSKAAVSQTARTTSHARRAPRAAVTATASMSTSSAAARARGDESPQGKEPADGGSSRSLSAENSAAGSDAPKRDAAERVYELYRHDKLVMHTMPVWKVR